MNPPTSDASSPPEQERLAMRRVVTGLGWIKTALIFLAALALTVGGGGSDPAGRAYLFGGFVLGGIYWSAFILPALVIARRGPGRLLGLALALLILPDCAIVLAALVL